MERLRRVEIMSSSPRKRNGAKLSEAYTRNEPYRSCVGSLGHSQTVDAMMWAPGPSGPAREYVLNLVPLRIRGNDGEAFGAPVVPPSHRWPVGQPNTGQPFNRSGIAFWQDGRIGAAGLIRRAAKGDGDHGSI